MRTLHFAIVIHAPRAAVWDIMLHPDTFRTWTAVFGEGSYFEGSWNEGDRIRFLTPDGRGMTSVIAENRPYEFISVQHVGYVKDGVEDTDSAEVRAWAPAFEDYTFSDAGSGTVLEVDVDVAPEDEAHMRDTWPDALERLKELCEIGL